MRVARLLLLFLALAAGNATGQPGEPELRKQLRGMERQVNREPVETLRELESLAAAYERADRETQLWYLLRRAQAHGALFQEDAFEEDIAQAQSLLLAGASGELALWIQTYAAFVEIRRGELNRGVEILANIAERAQQQGPSRVYVFAVQELAYTRGLLERYPQSLEDLHNAYAVAVELNQPDLVAMVDDAYGSVYAYMHDYPRSISYYNKALAEFMRLGYKQQIASVILGIASTHRYAREWDEAEDNFKRYLDFTRYAPEGAQLYYGNYGLAMTIAERGDCERAVPLIQQTLAYEGPEDYDAELYKRLAICQLRQGDVAAGEASLNRATDILSAMPELEGTSWMLELRYIESLLELVSGNTGEAYAKLDAYQDAARGSMIRNASNRMNLLRSDLEYSRQDLEIALLQEQAEVYRLQLETYVQETQVQRAIIVGISVTALLILAGFLIQRSSNRRIKELSYRDGLSGLYNRNYTFNYLEEVIPRINVESGGLSVILLDVDNFKTINDRFGHPVGDRVIQQIAEIGENSLRSRDIMGRIGGEEFLCVLPRTTVEQSRQVAERLLTAISEETFVAADGKPFSVSISIGVADFDSSVHTSDELYSRADKALYRAKTSGKGCIATYDPGVTAVPA